MELICICTEISHYWLDDWIETAKYWNYSYTILGQGQKWTGFSFKMESFIKYISTRNGTDIVALVDCYDVLMCGPPCELVKKFKEIRTPIVCGTEQTCGPNCVPLKTKTSSPYKYLNGGFIMGYANNLKQLFEKALRICPYDDQTALCICANDSDSSLIGFDFNQSLVHNCMSLRDVELIPGKRILHTMFDTQPCVIHIPFIEKDLGKRNNFIRNHLLFNWKPRLTRIDWAILFGNKLARETMLNPCYDNMIVIILVSIFVVGFFSYKIYKYIKK